MDSPWLLFIFLSVFHVIGAAVLANALRDLWHDVREGGLRGCRPAFLTIWAAMFGCLPFGFGIGFAGAETGTPLLLLGEILVWTSAFLVALLAKQALKRFLEPFLHQETLLMLFGGGFMTAGVSVASLVREEEGFSGLLIGGIFMLVGGAIFAYGLWRLFRSTR
jgi:hypothetical protein